MENLAWGLQMTVLGMGLVFALLALLWVAARGGLRVQASDWGGALIGGLLLIGLRSLRRTARGLSFLLTHTFLRMRETCVLIFARKPSIVATVETEPSMW